MGIDEKTISLEDKIIGLEKKIYDELKEKTHKLEEMAESLKLLDEKYDFLTMLIICRVHNIVKAIKIGMINQDTIDFKLSDDFINDFLNSELSFGKDTTEQDFVQLDIREIIHGNKNTKHLQC